MPILKQPICPNCQLRMKHTPIKYMTFHHYTCEKCGFHACIGDRYSIQNTLNHLLKKSSQVDWIKKSPTDILVKFKDTPIWYEQIDGYSVPHGGPGKIYQYKKEEKTDGSNNVYN